MLMYFSISIKHLYQKFKQLIELYVILLYNSPKEVIAWLTED
nr:MAG TPA: hypothetical protein [Caudoviricetes sp.]